MKVACRTESLPTPSRKLPARRRISSFSVSISKLFRTPVDQLLTLDTQPPDVPERPHTADQSQRLVTITVLNRVIDGPPVDSPARGRAEPRSVLADHHHRGSLQGARRTRQSTHGGGRAGCSRRAMKAASESAKARTSCNILKRGGSAPSR